MSQRTNFPNWVRPAAIIVAIALLGGWLSQQWLGWSLASAARPWQAARSWVRDRWRPANDVQAEREQLRNQLARVTADLNALQQQLETAETLNRLEGFISERQFRSVTTRVASISPDPGIQSVVIPVGLSAGVKAGYAVVTDNGALIGVVQRVQPRSSVVLLTTDPQTKLLVKIRNEAASRGIVSGEQGIGLRMDFIPKQDAIEAGQLVVTSGLDANIPADLTVGTVGNVTERSGELFKNATIITLAEPRQIDVVAVIIP